MDPDTPIQSIEGPTQHTKSVGSTWIVRYNGSRWPAVLCNESAPSKLFMETRRSEHVRPAILLGRHCFIWVNEDTLEEYVPSKDYLPGQRTFQSEEIQPGDGENTRNEKLRYIAFHHDAPEMRNDKYWSHHIQNKSAARKLEKELAQKHRRKLESISIDDDNDDEIQLISSRTRNSNPGGSSPAERHENRKTKRRRTAGYLPSPRSSPLRARSRNLANPSTGNGVIELEDDPGSDQDTISISQSSASSFGDEEPITAADRTKVKHAEEIVKSEDTCEILVGEGRMPFLLHKQDLVGCDYLVGLQQKNSLTGGTIIDLAADEHATAKTLTSKDFVYVFDFMKAKDIGPKYISEDGALSKVDTVPNEKAKWAEKLGKAFFAAAKVKHEPMEEIIYEKLKSLYPLDPTSILIIASIVSYMSVPETFSEIELAGWIVDHIAEYYWKLATEAGRPLQRVLEANDDLRFAVYAKLSGDRTMGKTRFE